MFKNDLGEISKEHPVIEIYKKKIFDKKKQAIKSYNQKNIEKPKPQAPEAKKTTEEARKKIDEPKGQSEESKKPSKANSRANEESFSSTSSKNRQKKHSSLSKNSANEKYSKEYLKSINSDCEKLCEFGIKTIEFYNTENKIDKDLYQQLLEKIEDYIQLFGKEVEEDSRPVEFNDFFLFWIEKFSELKNALSLIPAELGEQQILSKKNSLASSINFDKENSVSEDFVEEV